MSLIKKFATTSMTYFIGRILSGVVTFFLLPIYTRQIDPSAYGNYEVVNSLMNVLIPLLCIEVWSGVLRISFINESREWKNTVYSSGIALSVFSLAIFLAGLLAINYFFNIDNTLLIAAYGIAMTFSLLCGMIARAEGKNIEYAVSGIISSLVNAITGLTCVYYFHLQESTLFFAIIMGYVAQVVWLFISLKMWEKISIHLIKKSMLHKLISFCYPLGLNTILNYLQNDFRKLIIASYLGLSVLAIFSVTMKFMLVASLLVSVIHLAWQEIIYDIHSEQNKSYIYSIGLKFFMRIVASASVVLIPMIYILYPFFIGPEYDAAKYLIPLLYFPLFFTTITGFQNNLLTAENQTKQLFLCKLISCTINLLIVFLFIKQFGLIVVAIGAIIGGLIELCFVSIFVGKRITMKYDYSALLYYIIFFIVSTFVFYSDSILINYLWLGISICLGIFYCRNILMMFRRK